MASIVGPSGVLYAPPVPSSIVGTFAVAAQCDLGRDEKRHADEEAKRKQLASGALGLDLYSMREPLAKAGLIYLDEPETDRNEEVVAEVRRSRCYPSGWLPFLNTYRTMCRTPEPDFRQILEDVRALRFAA